MMPLAMSSGEIETSGYSHPMVRLRSSSRVGFWPCQTARERTSYSVRFGASTLVRADQTVERVTRRVARRLFQRVLERCYRRLIKTARTSENRREARSSRFAQARISAIGTKQTIRLHPPLSAIGVTADMALALNG
jgi:hypothetical protein